MKVSSFSGTMQARASVLIEVPREYDYNERKYVGSGGYRAEPKKLYATSASLEVKDGKIEWRLFGQIITKGGKPGQRSLRIPVAPVELLPAERAALVAEVNMLLGQFLVDAPELMAKLEQAMALT